MPPELAREHQFGNDVGITASLPARSPFREARSPRVRAPVETSYLLHLNAAEAGRLVEQLEARLPELGEPAVAMQARQLIARVRQLASHLDLRLLPPLRLTVLDDGSALIEWTLPDRRLGFNLERDATESGWYFATSPKSGPHMASGELSIDLARLLRWAFAPI